MMGYQPGRSKCCITYKTWKSIVPTMHCALWGVGWNSQEQEQSDVAFIKQTLPSPPSPTPEGHRTHL